MFPDWLSAPSVPWYQSLPGTDNATSHQHTGHTQSLPWPHAEPCLSVPSAMRCWTCRTRTRLSAASASLPRRLTVKPYLVPPSLARPSLLFCTTHVIRYITQSSAKLRSLRQAPKNLPHDGTRSSRWPPSLEVVRVGRARMAKAEGAIVGTPRWMSLAQSVATQR